jgi:uncharacterized protein (TIGR02246 family)
MSSRSMATRTVVLSFVRKINAHDVEGLAGLMTRDHVFVDSLGRSFKGREELRRGWKEYFRLFSHYTVSVTDVFEKRGTIVLLGTAGGIHVNPKSKERTKWKVPAAWKAVVRSGKISEWHVHADNFETAKLVSSD